MAESASSVQSGKFFRAMKEIEGMHDFQGCARTLLSFLNEAEEIIIKYNLTDSTKYNKFLLNKMRNKIAGFLQSDSMARNIPLTWKSIKHFLLLNFTSKTCESTLVYTLHNLQQDNLTAPEFYLQIQKMHAELMLKMMLNCNESIVAEAKAQYYEDLSLNTLINGLKHPLIFQNPKLKPTTLEKALFYIMEAQNLLYVKTNLPPEPVLHIVPFEVVEDHLSDYEIESGITKTSKKSPYIYLSSPFNARLRMFIHSGSTNSFISPDIFNQKGLNFYKPKKILVLANNTKFRHQIIVPCFADFKEKCDFKFYIYKFHSFFDGAIGWDNLIAVSALVDFGKNTFCTRRAAFNLHCKQPMRKVF